MRERSFSISAGAPMPLRTMSAPALANARAYASPMPLVDPVTTAVLPVNVPISFTPDYDRGLGAIPREIVGHHGFAGLGQLKPIFVTNREMNVALTGAPVLNHRDARKVIVLGRGFVILAAVYQMHHRDGVFLCRLAKNLHGRIVPEIIRQLAD